MSLLGSIINGVGSLAGGLIGANASESAANTQAAAANNATAVQQQQWAQTQANLKPYLNLGATATQPLLQSMGYTFNDNANGGLTLNGTDANNPLMQRFSAPTAAQAESTPGYQFTQQQGLKAVQNSMAARGLGTSGAALKGAAGYATGLADSTYNDVYQRALNTFNTNYQAQAGNVNRLQGLVGGGQNAAAGLGSLGAQTAGAIGNNIMGAGNAQAAGSIGASNALSGALSGAGNSAMLYGLMQNSALNNGGAQPAGQAWGGPSNNDTTV